MDEPIKKKKTLTKKHKRIIIITSIILIVTTIVSLGTWAGFYYQYGSDPIVENAEAKNIILMIGDGMGFNHIEAAKIYKKLPSLNMEALDIHGKVRTRSLSILPTDSAAAATAIATGYKVQNGEIGMHGKQTYENIFEIAKKKGKKVGFVTTKDACDATIAAFSSHVKNRNMYDEIIKQQIESDIDVIVGMGTKLYDPYADQINTTDRKYCKTIKDIKEAITNKKKIFAILEEEMAEHGESSLAEIVDYARRALENDNGFILLVEGAKIDTYSHSNEIVEMIKELSDFDKAVAKLTTYVSENRETFMMVTADHETGDLKIPNVEKATIENMETQNWFKSKHHTSADVPFFAIGPGCEEIPRRTPLDNTDIFHICKQLVENYTKNLPLAA